ncbi:hypothetical protein Hanom_Chr01g00000691 [Helianthus anomalus]
MLAHPLNHPEQSAAQSYYSYKVTNFTLFCSKAFHLFDYLKPFVLYHLFNAINYTQIPVLVKINNVSCL